MPTSGCGGGDHGRHQEGIDEMSLIQSNQDEAAHIVPTPSRHWNQARSLLLSWEVYFILLVTGFLHLYRLDTSEFDTDQATLFSMARNAVQHGLLPVVSNHASVSLENPPAFIYMLMGPASISSNPIWANVLVGLANVFAVLLTYLFTRRYYGRLAGVLAAILFTTARPLGYSRFIWQPNMLPLFATLFLFALFWGVVDRRKGWLFPALLLLGISYQLHPTAIFLCIPLLAALILAPSTIRWRDLAWGIVSLIVVFSPYILWEFISKFSDLSILLGVSGQHSVINSDVVSWYEVMLSPYSYFSYYYAAASSTSLLHWFFPILPWLRRVELLLAVAGLLTAAMLALIPAAAFTQQHRTPTSLRLWWSNFRASPYRCGLALLVIWQVVPILFLFRHAVDLHVYYLFMLLPGPFVLMGLFIAKIFSWLQHSSFNLFLPKFVLRYCLYFCVFLLLAAEVLTNGATIVDIANGNYTYWPGYNYNTLNSLQQALHDADQFALAHHLKRVYVATDATNDMALRYLAEQMQTPTTLFDSASCLVLPAPSAGPALLLLNPDPQAQLTQSLLNAYATTTVVAMPPRLEELPFKLYSVSSSPSADSVASQSFKNNLQFLGLQEKQFQLSGSNSTWLISHWTMLHSDQPVSGTTYSYTLNATMNAQSSSPLQSTCTFTSMHAGDQLIAAFPLPNTISSPGSVTLQGTMFTTAPYIPALGPLRLETDQVRNGAYATLQTTSGANNLTVPLS
jgi:4-amino-4-deoxy-L-arabinose transferase-like glycosyltransferase